MSSVFFQEAMLTFNNFENKKNMVDIFWLIPVFLRLSIFFNWTIFSPEEK